MRSLIRRIYTVITIAAFVFPLVASVQSQDGGSFCARARKDSSLQIRSVIISMNLYHGGLHLLVSPDAPLCSGPTRTYALSPTKRIVFSRFSHVNSPSDAAFYNNLLFATVDLIECAAKHTSSQNSCLTSKLSEEEICYEKYSTSLCIDNPQKLLDYGTLIAALKTMGNFFMDWDKNQCDFLIFEGKDPVAIGGGCMALPIDSTLNTTSVQEPYVLV